MYIVLTAAYVYNTAIHISCYQKCFIYHAQAERIFGHGPFQPLLQGQHPTDYNIGSQTLLKHVHKSYSCTLPLAVLHVTINLLCKVKIYSNRAVTYMLYKSHLLCDNLSSRR